MSQDTAQGSVATSLDAMRHADVEDPATPRADHFVCRDGMVFAGIHLIVDMWQATGLDDLSLVDAALAEAAEAAGATVLNIDLHHFTPNNGISGVAVLAESHISIHTWPERGYAALDIFMCGRTDPHAAVRVLRAALKPGRLQLMDHRRGILP